MKVLAKGLSTGPSEGSVSHGTGGGPRCAGAGEIDEAALRVGVDELHPHPIPDVEPLRSLSDAALDRRVEDAGPRPLGRGAGDDAVELAPDLAVEQASCRYLGDQAFHLLGIV